MVHFVEYDGVSYSKSVMDAMVRFGIVQRKRSKVVELFPASTTDSNKTTQTVSKTVNQGSPVHQQQSRPDSAPENGLKIIELQKTSSKNIQPSKTAWRPKVLSSDSQTVDPQNIIKNKLGEICSKITEDNFDKYLNRIRSMDLQGENMLTALKVVFRQAGDGSFTHNVLVKILDHFQSCHGGKNVLDKIKKITRDTMRPGYYTFEDEGKNVDYLNNTVLFSMKLVENKLIPMETVAGEIGSLLRKDAPAHINAILSALKSLSNSVENPRSFFKNNLKALHKQLYRVAAETSDARVKCLVDMYKQKKPFTQ